MAKAEFMLTGDYDWIIRQIENGITEGSVTATLEESSDYTVGYARMSVRVFERYSYSGGNRVSLTVTFFKPQGEVIYITAIATGGSQALLFKLNTFGEQAFLDKFREVIDSITE